MTIKNKFIIVFEGRTGSSMLCTLLNQNPRISCFGESVGQIFDQGWPAQKKWIETLCHAPSDLDRHRIKTSTESVGFKVKLRETASPDGLKQIIESHDFRVIHMTRSNIIKQVVSSIRAMDLHQKTGFYNLKAEAGAPPIPGAYPISPEGFAEIFQWLKNATERLDAFIENLERDIFHLSYENLTENPERSVKDLCDFLEVPAAPFKARTKKITPDDLSECITNYEELRSLYRETPYYDMF